MINTNSKGQLHCYHERYWNGKLQFRTNMKNGRFIGYGEYHHNTKTYFHIR